MPWHPTPVLAVDPSRSTAVVPIVVDSTAIVLVSRDGSWYAVEDRCSHAGCAFSEDGQFDGDHVICDCHGSEFDVRSGAVVRPPAVDPIVTYPVRIGASDLLEVEW